MINMTTAGVEVSFWTSYSWTTPKWYKTKTGSKETKVFFFEPVLSSQKKSATYYSPDHCKLASSVECM